MNQRRTLVGHTWFRHGDTLLLWESGQTWNVSHWSDDDLAAFLEQDDKLSTVEMLEELTATEELSEIMYTVTFVGEYFTMTTSIYSTSEQQAIDDATTALQEQYGWNIQAVSNDITVEKETN